MTMTEYKYRLRRCMAIALSVTLSAGCLLTGTSSALAAGQSSKEASMTKEETVYIVADPNGNPNSEIVSAWLKNPEGMDQIKDQSDLSDIELTKGDQEYTTEAEGKLVWQAKGSDIHYQGKTTKELPVDTRITYQLDGREVKPEELAGASGHLVMTIQYQNNTGEKKMVNGKAITMYQPFLAVSTIMFDNKKATDITVDHGKVIDSGEQTIVAGMAMPGLKESLGLEGKKDKDGKALDLGFDDTVTIEAEITGFSLLTTLTMFDNSALQELDLDQLDDLKDMNKDMDKLADGADELEDGSEELAKGTSDLAEGAGTLIDGVKTLNQGAKELEAGINSAKEGSFTLKDGIDTAASGADTISLNLKTLAEGAAGLDTSMPTFLEGMKQLKAGTVTLKKGTATYIEGVDTFIDNSTAAIKQLAAGGQQLSGLENLGQVSEAVNTIAGGLGNEEAEGSLVYGCYRVDAGLKSLAGKLATLTESTDAQNLEKLGKGIGDMRSGIETAGQVIDGAKAQLSQDAGNLNEKIEGLNKRIESVNSQAKKYNSGVEALESSKEDLNAQADQANGQIEAARSEINAAISLLEEAAAATEDQADKSALQSKIQSLKSVSIDKVSAGEVSLPDKMEAVEEMESFQPDTSSYESSKATLSKISTSLEAGLEALPSDIDNSSMAELSGAVDQLSQGATANLNGAKQLAGGAAQLKNATDSFPVAAAGMQQLNAGLSQMADENGTFILGGAKLKASGPEIEAGIESLKEGEKTLIKGAGSIQEGAGALAAGSGQLYSGSLTLSDGMSQLSVGAADLTSGMGQLSDGAGQLSDGTGSLGAGSGDLADGVDKLNDGAKQLADGMKELNEEGISKLTELLEGDLEDLADRVKVLQKFSKEYNSFSGLDKDAKGSVRFILRTDGIGE